MAFLPTEDLYDNEIYLRLDRTAEENKEKGYVPAYYFTICLRDNSQEIGSCDLRIGYNDNTYYGGNIGLKSHTVEITMRPRRAACFLSWPENMG